MSNIRTVFNQIVNAFETRTTYLNMTAIFRKTYS